jgi:hypothetical protein
MSMNVMEDCVNHCEELSLLSDMRSRGRNEKREKRDAKAYEDCSDLIQSGILQKLTVKYITGQVHGPLSTAT